MEHLAHLILECMSEREGSVSDAFPHAAEELAALIEKRFGNPRLPDAAETVAVTLNKYKTGALFFDRLWCVPCLEDGPPDEVRVWGATDVEVWPTILALSFNPPSPLIWGEVERVFGRNTVMAELWAQKVPAERTICDALFAAHRLNAVPMYKSADACSREYGIGETEAIVTAIENLGVVNEARLDWRQVMEFRNDPDAKIKLRRMSHWFDCEFVGKPTSYVTDAIAARLDDYEWALKKYGIETVTGSLSELLDVRFLSAASAAMAALAVTGGPSWAAIGAAELLLGKATLSVTTKLVNLEDRKRGQGSEVAFIHELKRISEQ